MERQCDSVFYFCSPGEGEGSSESPHLQVIPVSQQRSADNVSIDDIPIDIDNAHSPEFEPTDVPGEIESITRGLASERPPTNPLVVLKAARW